jgi:hypothetical protein
MATLRQLFFLIVCIIGTSSLFWAEKIFAQEELELDWRTELQQIDAELKELQDEKNRYLAAARRYDDQGMRWQFQQNQKQEAKRAFHMADIKRQAADMLQARIDALNARKTQILQEHPEANAL